MNVIDDFRPFVDDVSQAIVNSICRQFGFSLNVFSSVQTVLRPSFPVFRLERR
jgi:hypothetical protein